MDRKEPSTLEMFRALWNTNDSDFRMFLIHAGLHLFTVVLAVIIVMLPFKVDKLEDDIAQLTQSSAAAYEYAMAYDAARDNGSAQAVSYAD